MSLKKKLAIVLMSVLCALTLGLAVGCGSGLQGHTPEYEVCYVNELGVERYVRVREGEKANISPQTREGYAFGGFYSGQDGAGVMYVDANGIGVVAITSNLTVYAKWTPNEYTIVFSAGSYTGATIDASLSYNVTFDTSVSSVVFPSVSLEGQTFLGWYAGSNQVTNGTKLLEEMSVLNVSYLVAASNTSIVLTPKFTEMQFTVTFDYNNSNFSDSVERKIGYFNNGLDDVSVPAPGNVSGADFVGWSTNPFSLAEYTGAVDRDITLYGIWRKYKTVTVDLGDNLISSVKLYEDTGNFIPERNGYDFDDWYTNDSFSGSSRTQLSYANANENITYYAKFSMATYTVTFVSNCDATLSSLTYTIEDTLRLPADLIKEHYTFLGWCEEEDCSGRTLTTLNAGSYGNKTLYANFKGDDIRVTLLNDGASSNAIVEYGATYNLPIPARDGYAFTGWYTTASGGVQYTDANGDSLAAWAHAEDGFTLYAQWSQKCFLTVSVDIGGEPDTNGIVEFSPNLKEYYAVGERVAFTVNLTDDGYRFIKIVNNTVDTVLNNANYSFTMPTSGYDLTVYVEAKTFQITLEKNGGICSGNSASVTYNKSYTLPVVMKDNNTFLGWAYNGTLVTDANGNSLAPWSYTEQVSLTASFQESTQRVFAISDSASFMRIYEYPDATFYLTNNVNVTDATRSEKSNITFSGVLEGNGYTVSNITGERGLFETLTGTVCNLTLNVTILNEVKSRYLGCGAVAANLNGATVHHVTVNGTIICASSIDGTNIGGIAGTAHTNPSSVYNCTNNATIKGCHGSGGGCAGGILGAVNVTCTKFENNVNNGTVTGEKNVGGIIGYMNVAQTLKECVNTGDVSMTTTKGYVGGFLGNQNGRTVTIVGGSTTGTVTGSTYAGKYVGGGSYTLDNVTVEVSTAAQLAEMSSAIKGERYVLTANINAGAWTAFNFAAVLDGNGHSIAFSGESGLFVTLTGTVCNLTLNVDIHNKTQTGNPYRLGGVANTLNGGTIYNVTVNGSIVSDTATDAGGIVGVAGGTFSIYNCANHATVTSVYNGNGSAGGIIGSKSSTIAKFENNSNSGNITCGQQVGGIIGYNGSTSIITNCSNTGVITATVQNAGGIVGNASSAVTLNNCISVTTVSAPSNFGKYVGRGSVTYQNMNHVIEVATAEELAAAKMHVATEIYKLTANINLQTVWEAFDFSATLDGNGYKIIGLTNSTGLFSTLTGTVCNLTLESVALSSTSTSYFYMGAVAGTANGATIYNVTVSGRVDGSGGTAGSEVGGLVGRAVTTATSIYNCVNDATVSGNYNNAGSGCAGGILGDAGIALTRFEGNENHGTVNGRLHVGGLIGYANKNVTIKDCTNTATVAATDRYAGGILGRAASGTIVLDGCLSQDTTVTAASYSGRYVGDGTVTYSNMDYRYSVASQADFVKAKGAVAQETYELTQDITLTDWDTESAFDFAGTFNGNGYTVTIHGSRGLFLTLTGTVQNVTVAADITYTSTSGTVYLGGVASTLNGATVQGVTVTGFISGLGGVNVGGIAGYAVTKSSAISNCVNAAQIIGEYYEGSSRNGCAGGIVGYLNCTPSRFESNRNSGNVYGGRLVGGMIGYMNASVTITNCYNSASIKALRQYKVSSGGTCDFAGGFVGYINSGSLTLNSCYSTDSATSEGGNANQYVARGSYQSVNMGLEIEIATAAQLSQIKGSIVPRIYTLTADLTIADWTAFEFFGILNGNGHTITLSGDSGLFTKITGNVSDLTLVLNLTIKNTEAGAYYGGLANVAEDGCKFEQVTVTGSISVTGESATVGAIVGNGEDAMFTDCVTEGVTVSGEAVAS